MDNDEVEITSKQIYEEIVENRNELRNSIEASEVRVLLKIESLNNKIKTVEKENRELKNKVELLDRDSRRNNLIIFRLDSDPREVSVDFISNQIKQLLNVQLNESNINNLYTLGNAENSPIKLELVSVLKKREILQNCRKLKGSKIYIANDLTEEQRNENKILREHLNQARENPENRCYIKGYVNNVAYTVEDLKYEREPEPRSKSTPPTPNITFNPASNQEKTIKAPIIEQLQTNTRESQTNQLVKEQKPTSLPKHFNTPKTGTIKKLTERAVVPSTKETVRNGLRSNKYWAVTNIDYVHQRTSKRIGIMIFIIWIVSFLVCIAPLLGWKDPKWDDRIREKECMVSQDIYYQIFATSSSFYLPLLVILILYWRIFQTARKRIRRRHAVSSAETQPDKNPAAGGTGGIAGGLAAASGTGGIAAAVVTIIGRPLPTISETTNTTAFTTVSSNSSPEKTSFANGLESDMPTTIDCSITYQPQHFHPVKRKSRDSADSKRERKAAKTLAIITGAFVLCWLPFFIMALLLPINENCFEKYVISLFLWLGYFNSTLNPIIYTIFSPEFRHAFKKILCGRNYARRNRHFGIQHFQ